MVVAFIGKDTDHKVNTQRELATFIEQEQAKAKMQSSIHDLTDRCWNT
jgi:hypothetical protein